MAINITFLCAEFYLYGAWITKTGILGTEVVFDDEEPFKKEMIFSYEGRRMKKIAVCGDSFSAVSITQPGTHYSELLADRLGWQLLNYARRGCSNGGIRLQIDEAIRQHADFVIIVPTSWDRTEIPATAAPYTKTREDTGWGHPLQDHLLNVDIKNGYNPAYGISNINYSKEHPSTMIFETIFSLAENQGHEYRNDLDKYTHQAIQGYVNFIYDSNWKRQCDQWIMISGITALHDAGIPFSVEPGMLWDKWPRDAFDASMPKFLDPRSVRRENEETISYATNLYPLKDTNNDPGYHGEPESQQHIANFYSDLIIKVWEIK